MATKDGTLFNVSNVDPMDLGPTQTDVDIVKLEITHIDSKPFWGSLPEDTIRSIWTKTFGRNKSEINSYNFKIVKNKCLKINFELRATVKITELSPTPLFSFPYSDLAGTHLMYGKIVDYKVEDALIGDIILISVSRTASEVKSSLIASWLKHFGDPIGEPYYDIDIEGVQTGSYHQKLLLKHHIPEFLPIGGLKARVFYAGMPKQCTKCYRVGHIQKTCKNEKIQWLDFVERLYGTGLYSSSLFGSWIDILVDRIRQGREGGNRDRSPSLNTRANNTRKYRPGPSKYREKRDRSPKNRRFEKRDRSPYNKRTENRNSNYYRDRSSNRYEYRDRSPKRYRDDHHRLSPQDTYSSTRDRSPKNRASRKPSPKRDRSPYQHRNKARKERSPSSSPDHWSSARTIRVVSEGRLSAKARLGIRHNNLESTPIFRKRNRDDKEDNDDDKDPKLPKTDRGY